jgi:hypothetical protein
MALSILNLALSLLGGGVGAYVGLRVALTRLQEQMKATNERLVDHGERIKRLEGVYFGREMR